MKPFTRSKKLTLWFNRKARESAARQLIRATWLTPGLAAYFAQGKNSLLALAAIVVSWFVLQIGAHVILSLEERKTEAPDEPDLNSVEPKPASLGHADSVPEVRKRIAAKSGKRLTGDLHST
jgi:hypothetical protein